MSALNFSFIMRCQPLNRKATLVYFIVCSISFVSSSFVPFNETLPREQNKIHKKSTINVVEAYDKYQWITSGGDMVKKIPIDGKRHLIRAVTSDNDEMMLEKEFYSGDINDIRKPSQISGREAFWKLLGQIDDNKKPPLYTQEDELSRPVLTTFRYAVVPIWWSDEDSSDPSKDINVEQINRVMKYCHDYYKRMSFEKFNFQDPLILEQSMIPLSSENPGFGELENTARAHLDEEGYTENTDYNGVVILYNTSKNGPFSGNGGWGTVNSDLSITWMSKWGNVNDVARHEFGHNFGHPHHLTNKYLYRKGLEGTVGYDGYDMMSGGNAYTISDLSFSSKWYFGWVADSSLKLMQPHGKDKNCASCVSQGKYTLHPFDAGDDPSKLMGVHIPITSRGSTLYSYWLSYRSGNPARIGLSVHIGWFDSIGSGQFGASYNSLNYDAHGDTDTTADSFILPGTCYHVSPSKKMLEIDPVASLAIQPVVCVDELSEGNFIKIDVSFLDAPNELLETNLNIDTDNEINMECGTTLDINVDPSENYLLHVQNTGENGDLTLDLCHVSGSVTAYVYDRYPYSPINYSSPGGYGAHKSLNVKAPCSGSSSIEYQTIHNEAWVLIEGTSGLNGKTQVTANCEVNECQYEQKLTGGQCVPCKSGESGCKTCPAGLEFLISTCVLQNTFKEIERSTQWRIWAPDFHTMRGWVWDVSDLKFYSDIECTGNYFNNGTPIDSGNAGGGWSAANAFDNNIFSRWGGRSDEDDLFWLGMSFQDSILVKCVSFLDHENNGVTQLRVQAWESSINSWQNVQIARNLQAGQRTIIPLEYTPTSSPSVARTLAPTGAPTFPTSTPTIPPTLPTLAPTPSPTEEGYKKLRIWAKASFTVSGWVWDVKDLNLYSDWDCKGTKFDDGTAIDSGNAGSGWGPERAFDQSISSAWGGRSDDDDNFWIGMEFDTLKNIKCISFVDGSHGAREIRVQVWDINSDDWLNVAEGKNHVPETRQNVAIIAPRTSTPTTSPTTAPTTSPTTAPTTAPTTSPTSIPTCSDDTKWKFKGNKKKNCNWVRAKPTNRCKLKGGSNNDIKANAACPIACGIYIHMKENNKKLTRQAKCKAAKCLDGSDWAPKNSKVKNFKKCGDLEKFKGKKLRKYCKYVGYDYTNHQGTKVHLAYAYEACKKCGYCKL